VDKTKTGLVRAQERASNQPDQNNFMRGLLPLHFRPRMSTEQTRERLFYSSAYIPDNSSHYSGRSEDYQRHHRNHPHDNSEWIHFTSFHHSRHLLWTNPCRIIAVDCPEQPYDHSNPSADSGLANKMSDEPQDQSS